MVSLITDSGDNMKRENSIDIVKNAMLAVQRYPWEQGVCAQALYESGDIKTAVAMAYDAVLRQQADGRLAVINQNIAVTDPAASGEVVLRAYELTGDPFYKTAADRMLHYLLKKAPKTQEGIIYHNEISFHQGYSPYQIWADAIYMAPPFIAAMGEVEEACRQIEGYFHYLYLPEKKLLCHIYDVGTRQYVRKKIWATGNGWALMGIARVADIACDMGRLDIYDKLIGLGIALLDNMLTYQLSDGRFHDILDDDTTFVDGTAAMMAAAFIYRGCGRSWLAEEYIERAELVVEVMEHYVDEFGIIHGVCGCPDFLKEGTSAESMASYIMMHSWRDLYRARQ